MGKKRETKIIDGILYSKCSKCGAWLKVNKENFRLDTQNEFLLSVKCKFCFRKEEKDRYANKKERFKLLERSKAYYFNNLEKVKEYKRDYYINNKDKVKSKLKENATSTVLFSMYVHQLTIEESPKEGKNGKLMVKCAYCGKYFYPIARFVRNRVSSLKGTQNGELRLYCSDGCKDACPIYNQNKFPKGFKQATSREVDHLIRQMCLERDNYTCQRCEKTIDQVELHCHHIEGVTQQPMLANDIENTITLCKKCHKLVHKQDKCGYHDLRCKK